MVRRDSYNPSLCYICRRVNYIAFLKPHTWFFRLNKCFNYKLIYIIFFHAKRTKSHLGQKGGQ